ncbi:MULTISPECIES: hypothetical protein [unclassified Streptomyces]|uniref:hypothetical protein n=1 Tax=unclassified Streptomyces TaxID=2593676 RepID=UPI00073B2B9F|nr:MULTISPECIES: hypothetical protein [unclassified Streptomyces]ODA71034.1 hypothetical protein APS67_004711 [Streptomyces sp. AVP053U2]
MAPARPRLAGGTSAAESGLRVIRGLLFLPAPPPRTTVRANSVIGRTGLMVRYGRETAAVLGLAMAGLRSYGRQG